MLCRVQFIFYYKLVRILANISCKMTRKKSGKNPDYYLLRLFSHLISLFNDILDMSSCQCQQKSRANHLTSVKMFQIMLLDWFFSWYFCIRYEAFWFFLETLDNVESLLTLPLLWKSFPLKLIFVIAENLNFHFIWLYCILRQSLI